jgi:siroheme synthase
LVTLKVKECVEQAEVIVYDYLCNPEIRMGAWRRGNLLRRKRLARTP